MYFTPAWHLRKHCCYRPNSVCCLLSADPHGNRSSPGVSQQSSPDCGERHLASGERNGLVCQCFRATRAASFWSSKLGGFHHFSSQSVLQHVFYLGQDITGTMLMVQVLTPEPGGQMPLTPLENRRILLQVTVQQQRSSSWTPCHPDASLLLASAQINWMKKKVFSK